MMKLDNGKTQDTGLFVRCYEVREEVISLVNSTQIQNSKRAFQKYRVMQKSSGREVEEYYCSEIRHEYCT